MNDTAPSHSQLKKIAHEMVAELKRLPTSRELTQRTGVPPTKSAVAMTEVRREVVQLLVTPDGKVYDPHGKTVWKQNTAGSLVVACFRQDKNIGPVIYG